MTSRREIEELLPAYVNGSLAGPDRATVERALADDPALRDELRFLQMLQDGLQSRATDPTPGTMGWHRLRRRIGEPGVPPQKQHGWRQAAAIAAAVLILVQGGLLWQAYDGDTGYRMLGGESAAQLQVRFVADAPAGEIAELLAAEDLEIVSGPGAAGVYRLRTGEPATEAEIDAMMERLSRQDAIVAFVARE